MVDELEVVTKAIASSMVDGLLSTLTILKLGKIVPISDGIYGIDSKWVKDGKGHEYQFKIKLLDEGTFIW